MNYKLYWELTNEGDARLLRAFGEMPEPRFPAEIEGRAITEIGDYCFAAQAHLPAECRCSYEQGGTEADGAPRALTAWLPFTLRLEHPAAKDDTQILMDCRVLAASFKNAEQVHRCAMAGCQSVTVSADILKAVISHPMTDAAVTGFDRDWTGVYGGRTILDF